jgi:hypothetical protein
MPPRKPKPLIDAEPTPEPSAKPVRKQRPKQLTDAEKLAVIEGIVNDPDIRRVRVRREAVLKIQQVLRGEAELVIEVTEPHSSEDLEEVPGEDKTGDETEDGQVGDAPGSDTSEDTNEGAEGASRSW